MPILTSIDYMRMERYSLRPVYIAMLNSTKTCRNCYDSYHFDRMKSKLLKAKEVSYKSSENVSRTMRSSHSVVRISSQPVFSVIKVTDLYAMLAVLVLIDVSVMVPYF